MARWPSESGFLGQLEHLIEEGLQLRAFLVRQLRRQHLEELLAVRHVLVSLAGFLEVKPLQQFLGWLVEIDFLRILTIPGNAFLTAGGKRSGSLRSQASISWTAKN